MHPVSRAKFFDGIRFKLGFLSSHLKWRLLGLRMGKKVEIYANVVIHDAARITIGDNSAILSFTVLFGSGGIVIGRDVLISSNCSIFSITHRVDALERGLLYRETRSMAPVVVGNNVWIGTGASILPGVSIGENTIVGAGSVVTHSLPSGVLALGVPARIVRTLKGPQTGGMSAKFFTPKGLAQGPT
jgi:maltose O-acetyltransferase